MTKDRLAALRTAQNAEDSDPDAAYVELNLEDNNGVMSDIFAPVNALRTNIDKISDLVEEVKRLHSTILTASESDDRRKDELEQKMNDIRKLSKDVPQELKTMETELEQEGNENAWRTADLRIQKTQLQSLSFKFRDVMADYYQVQVAYRQKCKEGIQRQLEITGRSVTEGEVEEMIESGNLAIFAEGIMVETLQAKQSLADIQARHADIIKLEKSIRELHEMFVDMAALVQTQGEMIDQILYNVRETEVYVENATKSVGIAVEYQEKARRKKIFIWAICIIIIAIVLIIIGAIVAGTLTAA